MIKVGIVGGTGYTGVELLRLLAAHPQVELQVITSRADAGTPVSQMFPSLRGYVDLPFTHPDEAKLEQCDLVFFATPNGIAMQQTRALLDAGVKVIDLAADFPARQVGATLVVRQDAGEATFDLSSDALVDAQIVSPSGRALRDVARSRALAAGTNSLNWDGRSSLGANLPAGVYLVQITATTEEGQSVRAVRPMVLTR